jgi:hypothetical protein
VRPAVRPCVTRSCLTVRLSAFPAFCVLRSLRGILPAKWRKKSTEVKRPPTTRFTTTDQPMVDVAALCSPTTTAFGLQAIGSSSSSGNSSGDSSGGGTSTCCLSCGDLVLLLPPDSAPEPFWLAQVTADFRYTESSSQVDRVALQTLCEADCSTPAQHIYIMEQRRPLRLSVSCLITDERGEVVAFDPATRLEDDALQYLIPQSIFEECAELVRAARRRNRQRPSADDTPADEDEDGDAVMESAPAAASSSASSFASASSSAASSSSSSAPSPAHTDAAASSSSSYAGMGAPLPASAAPAVPRRSPQRRRSGR